MANLDVLAREHHAFVAADSTFQRQARLLQALWREQQGYPAGAIPGALQGGRRVDSLTPYALRSLTLYVSRITSCG